MKSHQRSALGLFLVLLTAALLTATSAYADCLLLPIIGDGHDVPGKDESALDDLHGGFRPKIPAALIAVDPKLANVWTAGAFPPVMNGLPTRSTVYTCFPDSLKIPASLLPITRDDTARLISALDSKIVFKPDALKVPAPVSKIQSAIERAVNVAWSYISPAIAWATTATDDFNRADNADLGANWDAYDNPSSAPCQILSNQVENTTTGVDCVEGYNAYIPGANQYAQISLPSGFLTNGFLFVSALIRLQASPTYSGYVCRAQPPDQINTSRLRRVDAGSMSTLANETATTWTAGDVLRCEVTGSSLTLKRNGSTLLSASEATYGSGRTGINIFDDPVAFANPIDDFEVGDLGVTTVVRHRPVVIQ